MPDRFYATTHSLPAGDRDSSASAATNPVLRIIHLDACLLVCGQAGNFRCEDAMQQNFPPGSTTMQEHLRWIREELAKPARFRIVVGHWPVYSFLGNG